MTALAQLKRDPAAGLRAQRRRPALRKGVARRAAAACRPAHWRRTALAYAVTGHSAKGRTVTIGIAVLTGKEDRHWLYVALTRGAAYNIAIVFTQPARIPDPRAGTRPAPELDRHHRIQRERAGLPTHPRPQSLPPPTHGTRPGSLPIPWPATTPGCPPPRPGTRTSPTPTTSPC
jgi:hypothetical protein